MGCDIHMVVEVKYENEWIGVNAFPYVTAECYPHNEGTARVGDRHDVPQADIGPVAGSVHWHVRGRNYDFFAALAGVRGDGPDPLGIPDDMSALARMEIDAWGSDGHSHSYCSAEHFIKLASEHGSIPDLVRKAVERGRDDVVRQAIGAYLIGVNVHEGMALEDIRVVFWFDN